MRYFDPIKDTPEGKLLSIVRDIEKAVGITKNMTCMNCEDTDEGCPSCKPNMEKAPKPDFIQKYIQERSGDNVKPMFMEISGKTEIPASGYQGNQHLPYTEDASESKAVSEVFKMPSVAQTGYDANASSLHMHYNDGGTGGSMYRDKVEESLATIKKEANAGQLGLIEEIAGKIEQLYARL